MTNEMMVASCKLLGFLGCYEGLLIFFHESRLGVFFCSTICWFMWHFFGHHPIRLWAGSSKEKSLANRMEANVTWTNPSGGTGNTNLS